MREKIVRILEVAVEPKTPADADRLSAALEKLAADDPSFGVTIDRESGQTIVQGTSELQLEEKLHCLENIPHSVGAPQVIYRETLSRAVAVGYAHKRQTGGSGEFACVTIEFIPLGFGEGTLFETAVDGVPAEFILAIQKGIAAQADSGLLAGFPVMDFKARLIDARYHEIDSSPLSFNIAARAAFRKLAEEKVAILLEPVAKVEIVTPQDYLGGVIGDINSRRGQVQSSVDSDIYAIITALVPVSNMFGYSNTLQSMCRGRAIYEMVFDHYVPVPDPTEPDKPFPGAIGMRVA